LKPNVKHHLLSTSVYSLVQILILRASLYRFNQCYETCSLICASRKIQRCICALWWMRVFENMTLRTIFGPRREEAEGRWSKLRHGSSMIVHLNKHSYGDSIQGG